MHHKLPPKHRRAIRVEIGDRVKYNDIIYKVTGRINLMTIVKLVLSGPNHEHHTVSFGNQDPVEIA